MHAENNTPSYVPCDCEPTTPQFFFFSGRVAAKSDSLAIDSPEAQCPSPRPLYPRNEKKVKQSRLRLIDHHPPTPAAHAPCLIAGPPQHIFARHGFFQTTGTRFPLNKDNSKQYQSQREHPGWHSSAHTKELGVKRALRNAAELSVKSSRPDAPRETPPPAKDQRKPDVQKKEILFFYLSPPSLFLSPPLCCCASFLSPVLVND